MKSHEQINEMLTGYALRELQSRDRKEILDHLENCAQCREELSRLESLLNCAQRMGEAAVDEQTCKDAGKSILAMIESQTVSQSDARVFSQFSKGKKTMKNSIFKIAAAALILTAAITAISIYSFKQEPKGKIAATKEEQLRIKTDAEQIRIEQMAAAKDVEGLIEMLDTGEYESKLKAAQWLGKIGEHRALPALRNLTSGDIPDGYSNAAVVEAIENITNTAETTAPQVTQDNGTMNLQVDTTVPVTKVIPANQLLDLIPAKTAFCAVVNNFDQTFGMIDQYASGIMPIPAAVTMGARTMLVSQIGNPALTGINTTGSFAVFGKAFSTEPNSNPLNNLFIGLLAPVPDYEKFVEGNPNYGPADANGISIIKTGGTVKPDQKKLGVRLGGYVLVGSAKSYDKLVSIAKSVAGGEPGIHSVLDRDVADSAMKDSLWGYTSVPEVSKVFGPMIRAQIEQLKSQLEKMNQDSSNAQAPPSSVMNMYFGMLEIITKELESVSVGLNYTPEVGKFKISFKPVADTYLAKMFSTDTSSTENKYLGYLDDGAAVNVGFKVNKNLLQEYFLSSFDLITFLDDANIPDESLIKTEELMSAAIDLMGEGAMCLGSGSEGNAAFGARYLFEVSDKEAFNKLEEGFVDLWNNGGYADIYRKIGMESKYSVQFGIEDYNGITIDGAKFSMKPTDTNSEYGRMITGMYGEGLDYMGAFVNGLYVGTMGFDAAKTATPELYALIDQVRSGINPKIASEMQAALDVLDNAAAADLVGTVNLVRYMKMAAGMMQATNPMMAETMVIDTETSGNIAFAVRVKNKKGILEIAVPKKHIIEIKTANEQMQGNMRKLMVKQESARNIAVAAGVDPQKFTDYEMLQKLDTAVDLESARSGLSSFSQITNGRYPASLASNAAVHEAGAAFRVLEIKAPNHPMLEKEIQKLIYINSACMFYDKLIADGTDVVYYGETVTTEFPHAVLMRWKAADGQYPVIFGDLSTAIVSPERLTDLESAPLNLTSKAIKPEPTDGAKSRAEDGLKLSWQPGIDSVTHRIYFGENPDMLSLFAELSSPFVDELSELKTDTAYYWRVDEVRVDGTVTNGDTWTFNTNKLCLWLKLDEAGGKIAFDSSGNGYSGILTGKENWKADGFNGRGCLSFDDDTAISVPTEVLSGIDRQITICVRLYGYDSTGRDNYVFDSGAGNTFLRASVPGISNNVVFQAGGADDIVSWNNSNPLDWRGSWKHYAFVKNAETLRIYCDGWLAAEKTDASPSIRGVRKQPFDIGALVERMYDYKGMMDDLRIYNYALDGEEILRIYNDK